MQAVSTSNPRLAVPTRVVTTLAYAAGCAVVLAIFIRFVVPAYIAGFAPDDPMNMDIYWSSGWWNLLKGLVLFFSTYYRPMGGLYYSTIYHFFGLNPLPYHIVTDALVLLNVWLAYRFAVLISSSRLTAFLTAVMLTYHGALAWLVYRPSFIYDVLCYTFFFLALNYYISIRKRGVLPTKAQALG